MATDTQKNSEFVLILKEVINSLQDGQKGFAELGEHLHDEDLKTFFLAESLRRASFRGELENELHRHGIADVHEEGTAAAAFVRGWTSLKAKLVNPSDHSLLEAADQGEHNALDVYRDAMAQDLPLPIRQLLAEQFSEIQVAHDIIRRQLNPVPAV